MRILSATFLLIIALFSVPKSFAESAVVLERSERIDQLVNRSLKKQGIVPTANIDDHTFLRRTYLSIGGRLPTLEEIDAFFGKEKEYRRAELIDQLLNSEAYVSSFYHFWADLLRINGQPGNTVSDAYELWVKDAIRENKPYDELVYELVTAEGKIWENGAVGYYYRDQGMPLDNMSNTVRVFLGTRLECAQCHDHPFDKWTQMDFFKMASFTYGINTRGYDSPNRNMITNQQKSAAKDAYLKKAKELTGASNFPVIKPNDLAKYQEKYPEKTELPEPVFTKKFDKKTKTYIKVEKKRKPPKLTPHEKLGLSKSEFINVVKQCHEAGKTAMGDQEVMRRVVKELYDPLQYVALSQKEKNAKLPHDYQYSDGDPHQSIDPETMFGKEIDLASTDVDRIKAYGSWMTSSSNPTFTKVIANRMWKKVFGYGVFEPVDELTDNTVVSNQKLLDYLVELLIDLDYDLREFQAVLYNTETFQRSAFQGEIELGEPYYFPGPVLTRMSAEQIWDSLVSMALPEADRYHPRLKEQIKRIDRVKNIYNQLEGKPFEEFFELVQQITPVVTANRDLFSELNQELDEAIKADDQKLVVSLRKEIYGLRKKLRTEVSDIAFPFLKEKADGEEILLAMGVSPSTMGGMMMEDAGSDTRAVMLKLPKPEYPEPPEELKGDDKSVKKARQRWNEKVRSQYRVYEKLIGRMARASELQSPARRGHFLRDFGQSDRELIDNASTQASVPQALNLLNGEIIQSLINPFSVFGSRLAEGESVEDKANLIFQAMLTRLPTEQEIKLVEAEVESKGDKAYEGLVWALLNTRQFLFIQ